MTHAVDRIAVVPDDAGLFQAVADSAALDFLRTAAAPRPVLPVAADA